MVRSLRITFAAGVLAASLSHGATAQTYQLTNIGIVSGASFSKPTVLDDTGGIIRVAGTSADKFGTAMSCWYWESGMAAGSPATIGPGTPYDVSHKGEVVGGGGNAFYWTRTSGYVALPFPATTPDGLSPFIDSHGRGAWANSINESGIICGTVSRYDLNSLPVVWQKVAGVWQVQYLAFLAGSPTASNGSVAAVSINEAGDIAGQVPSPTVPNSNRAVVWKNSAGPTAPAYGSPTDAGLTTETTLVDSSSVAINNNATAQVAGTGFDLAGNVHRFVWVPGFAPASFDAASVYGFSDDGAVAGSTYAFAGGALRAYYYKDGTMVDCGSLGGGKSSGSDVNSSGEVVGQSITTANSATYAFVWKNGSTMKNLGKLVTTGLGPFSRLTNARKIGGGGNITGEGITQKGGYSQAYVLKKTSP